MIELPEPWRRAAEEIAADPGEVLVLGAADAGKTTLIGWLASHPDLPRPCYVVDSDPGQGRSIPGLLVGGSEDFYFVGSNSPRGHLLGCAVGARRLCDCGRSRRAGLILVNTSGWVEDGAAIALAQALIELLTPRWVLGLARGVELEPILEPYRGLRMPRVRYLPVSTRAVRRTPLERSKRRQEAYRAYFGAGRLEEVALGRVGLSGMSPSALLSRGRPGMVLGLFDEENRCLGAGMLCGLESDRRVLQLQVPAGAAGRIRRLHLGRIELSADFSDVSPRKSPATRTFRARCAR
ncbi:MAG: hypothetical protein HY319_01665 [Armatimonadetes bacterium]|nr:hypothetical protein [Armatimonadota bacterium]